MNTNIFSKYKYIIVIIFIISIVGVFIAWQFQKTQILQISFINIDYVEIYNRSDITRGASNKIPVVKKLVKSGEENRLTKGRYVVYYAGKDGYESKYQYINLEDKPVKMNLTPLLSEEKLNKLLENEYPLISIAIQGINNSKLYTTQKGSLLYDGTWYITGLKYVGDDYRNYDSLRVIVHKNKGKWVVIEPGPSLYFGYDNYDFIPKTVIDSVNSLDLPEVDSKFLQTATSNTL